MRGQSEASRQRVDPKTHLEIADVVRVWGQILEVVGSRFAVAGSELVELATAGRIQQLVELL